MVLDLLFFAASAPDLHVHKFLSFLPWLMKELISEQLPES